MSVEIDFRCPEIVAKNAAKGLAFREKFGRGGTEVGVARARDLKNASAFHRRRLSGW